MPGDGLVMCPAMSATHAITVDAPADRVWPWLTQRGQEMKVGDVVRPGPQPYPVWVVWSLEPRRSLLLRTADPHTGRAVEEADVARGGWAGTWSFVLRPLNPWSTRLVVRLRIDWRRTPANALRGWGLTEPAHFVTERRVLKTIKALAERDRDCRRNGVVQR